MPIKKAITNSIEAHKDVINAIKKAGIPLEEEKENNIIQNYRKGKRTLKVIPKKGESMDTCATISDKYICCNVKVLKSVANCPYDCSYCFLQNYLNDGSLKIVGDEKALMEEVIEKCNKEPKKIFRIGTWELGDSLALEKETGQAQRFIHHFKNIPNAVLELKTKSNVVDPILKCNHNQKTVVSWSLNSEDIVNKQEHKTARLNERFEAIKKVTNAGYLIGIHFDPLIIHSNWEENYEYCIKTLFKHLNIEQVAWISIGSLRFNPEMKQKIIQNFPKTNITSNEMILGDDNKVRYVKPLRLKLYDHIIRLLKNELKINDLSPTKSFHKNKPLIYYCMERWDIWDHTFGDHPKSIEHLDYLFALSLHQRYPQSYPDQPELAHYLL